MVTPPPVAVLCPGDRLTRDEFERRYEAMPDLKKAELIEGVVYMMPRIPLVQHGRPVMVLSGWLGFYEEVTPGMESGSNCSVRLDLDNEPQPDLLARLPERAGGRSRIDADDFVAGPPELVIEVTASSVSYDLHQKLHAYRRNGVQEYLVHRFDEGEIDWFVLEHGTYVRQQADLEGILRSRVFPGLWLDVAAVLRDDLPALRRTVERGTADPSHAAFVARLGAR